MSDKAQKHFDYAVNGSREKVPNGLSGCHTKRKMGATFRILLFLICLIFEHTCAYAQWVHMHRFVCLSVIGPKFRLDNKSLDHNINWTMSHWTIIQTGQ